MNDRDCENCKHHTEKGCDSWDCNFEQGMTKEDIHREKEQAYMQGYEDACKKYRQEPKTGQWILSSEKMPENPSIVACDAYNNKPWIPRGILITETENGKKKLYDAATYNGNLKAFLKGKELTSFSGNTFYLPPREIIAWMPLPKPYNPQEESEETE